MEEELDFGVFVEGTVEELAPGRFIVRTVDESGKPIGIDVQKTLEKYKGEAMRFILTPVATIIKVAEMVEESESEPEV